MARIRTVKPEFFRHEELQELERKNPKLKPMLVFVALWGHCDKHGVFPWKPRQLKLDILPFLEFDLGETLGVLSDVGLVVKLQEKGSNGEATGKQWGIIPTFPDHQRISGKEFQESSKYPHPCEMIPAGEAAGKQQGSNGEATGNSRKGREQEGNRKGREGNIYGEFVNVSLTQSDFDKLVERYGETDAFARIERLSAYIASSGKRYKDHYATILAWANKDKPATVTPINTREVERQRILELNKQHCREFVSGGDV